MKVLVTGHRGYIGSVMTAVLQHGRHDVVGLDCDLYRGCDFGRVCDATPSLDTDIRDVEIADLLDFDAVIHLAALSDDTTADLSATLAEEINHSATLRLAECCKQAGVSRFLFASSCSVYGRGGYELLTEDSTLRPLSRYAELKLRCERDLARLADETFTPVLLRNATVYGVSPRLRLDLVANDFAASALVNRQVAMRTAGIASRPLVHVEDVARVYAAALTAPRQRIHNQVINVAASEENYRVIEIADMITDLMDRCPRISAKDEFDPRSYRVDGSKLRRIFPGLAFRWTLPLGVRQVITAGQNMGLTPAQWRSDRYRRTPRLLALMERGELDPTLRRTVPVLG